MSAIRCVVCTRSDPADGWTVCRRCLDRLDDNLARIAELVAWASSWLLPRTGSGNTGRSVPASRPPLDIASLDAAMANDVLPLLESWERLIRENASLSPYGVATSHENATVARSVTFLRSWLLRLAEDVRFPIEELAREVRELTTTLEHIDPDHERQDGIRIPCPADNAEADGRDCGYRLAVDARRPADDVECRRCGTVWTSGRLILVALNDPAVTVWAYPDVIEEALGIPKRTLQRWGQDGTVKRRSTQYDVGDAFRTRHERADA